jgi:hypothetical protein
MIKFQISIMVITPAIESAKACLASRLPSNLSALTANFPWKDDERFFMATFGLDQLFPVGQYRLIDVHYDRRHGHASGKRERKGHGYEYLCHAHTGHCYRSNPR